MKYICALLGFLSFSMAFAQSPSVLVGIEGTSVHDSILLTPFTPIERRPEFVGGVQAMNQFIAAHIQYPKDAQKAGIEGKVVIVMVVAADGYVQDVRVAKGIGYGCDEECVRMVKSMPRWKPGCQSGKEVSMRYALHIAFALDKSSPKDKP